MAKVLYLAYCATDEPQIKHLHPQTGHSKPNHLQGHATDCLHEQIAGHT